MKVALDTNVFISAVFFGGVPGRILTAWRRGEIQLVLSPEIVEEYAAVLQRLEKQYPPIQAEPIIDLLLSGAEMIAAPPFDKQISTDPDDDKFISCALAAKARAIVSGDKHLLDVKRLLGIEILRPSEFVRKHLKS